jgi:ferredoxin-type protein NapF
VASSRREFFNAFRKPLIQEVKAPVLRPPYGLNESLFQSECPVCESKACVTSCDEKIIVLLEDGTPSLNFTKSGCTFCDDCANACDINVLNLENTHSSEHLNAQFKISTDACVAHHGVICFSCKEPCIDDAILFNGMFNPVIDRDSCTACGFCMARCPTSAIQFDIKNMQVAKEIL